jgi:hypothetical protein
MTTNFIFDVCEDTDIGLVSDVAGRHLGELATKVWERREPEAELQLWVFFRINSDFLCSHVWW